MGECEVVIVRGKVGAELVIPYFSLEKPKGVYLLLRWSQIKLQVQGFTKLKFHFSIYTLTFHERVQNTT